nr:hypothetical protein [Ktedonobacteraceae bacterium]
MQEASIPLLTTWGNFYTITGTAAASLTGLMFVVMTLITSLRAHRSSGTASFATPTVVHFCAVLLMTAILSAPWPMLWNVSLLLGLTGLAGVIYEVIVLGRLRHLTDYKPVTEDWVWHTMFPFVSYTALLVASIVLLSSPVPALFVIASVTVLLLFIGIHNSWDTVTYIAVEV